MNISLSRFTIIAPALALVFIGVASVAFSWGASTGGSHGAPPDAAASSPVAPPGSAFRGSGQARPGP